MANEVFISYSRKDYEIVRKVKDSIDKELGIDCWMDLDGIESGDQFKEVIISAIVRHDYRAQNETYIKERGRKYVESLYL